MTINILIAIYIFRGRVWLIPRLKTVIFLYSYTHFLIIEKKNKNRSEGPKCTNTSPFY